ncbi:MAG: 2-phosphosulfolactate phosphatase [Desulfobacterota bacterium]|nr:2-phosphosulfolactate phosphatase [Thermodesulfobacteriota bacterium]
MKIICDSLYNGALAARGVAVIIDVFRAFTCAPLLFSMGVEKLFLIATPEQAFALKETDKDLILVGEVSGIPIKGFDFGNSPSEILKKDPSFFKGRTVLQRTSSGVQGALLALNVADEVLLGLGGQGDSAGRRVVCPLSLSPPGQWVLRPQRSAS